VHGLGSSGVDAVIERSRAGSPRERVHRLASFGGLVVLAGLDRIPPDLPLGILLEAAERLPLLSLGARSSRNAAPPDCASVMPRSAPVLCIVVQRGRTESSSRPASFTPSFGRSALSREPIGEAS